MKKRIGIRVPNWIGDAVMCLPVIKFIKEYFKNDEIFLILRSHLKPIFVNNKHYNKILLINDKKDGVFKTGLSLRKYRFDLFFNFPESLSSVFISFLSNAKIKIGYKGETFGLFLTKSYNPKNLNVHRSIKYFKLICFYLEKYNNISGNKLEKKFIQDMCSDLYLTKDEIKRGEKILSKHKTKKRVVGMNPNCSAPSRRWLKERFADLADILIEKHNISVLFFGSKKEKGYVSSIIRMMKQKPVNMAGKITLREYMMILKKIKLFITNDSGPMHLANGVGTDVIALEGPADVLETGMINKNSKRIYVNKNLKCAPCVKNKCIRNNKCMKAISVKDVLKQVNKIL